MLQAEKKVLAEYEKITVCVTIDDLPKGESITEDNILNYVQTVPGGSKSTAVLRG